MSKMYCIYLRKSRSDVEAEARGEGETYARHEKILFDLAKHRKISIAKIYREKPISGETISARPVMQKVLNEVEQGIWEGVLVVEVERLARGDTMDQGLVAQTFKYSNTKIITPMKVYDPSNEFDEEYFEFGLFMSRREYKTINRRLQRGRLESSKEGKYVGNIPPYGYVRVKLEGQKGYTLKPHPDQAPIVKLIFKRYASGIGISLIVRELNDFKIPTITGGVWVVATVRGILSNPVYAGKIRWGYRAQVKKMVEGEVVRERPRAAQADVYLYEGLHTPLISEVEFNFVQELLAKNPTTPAPKYRGVKNPLASLIVCGKCGRKMVRRPYGGRYPDTLMCPATACNNVSSLLSLVEEKLLQTLTVWLKKHEVNISAKEEKEENIGVLVQAYARLEKEIEKMEKQKNRLCDLLEQGVYTVDVFMERSRIISEKLDKAKANKEHLGLQIQEIENREKDKKELIPSIKKVVEIYHQLDTPKKKNDLLKSVLDKAIYTKESSSRWGKPDNFELDVFPRLNR